MNKKIKRKWCAGLRGGAWVQIKKRLSYEGTNYRCALGVLQEICPNADLYGGVLRGSDYNHVVRLNDEAGWSFNHIADWIEEHL